jgi:multiple sugar transport system permease protein
VTVNSKTGAMRASVAPTRRRKASKPDAIGLPNRVLFGLILALFAFYFLMPVWWLVVAATKSTGSLFASNGLWFSGRFDLAHNLQALFQYQDGVFWHWIVNTLGYAGIGGALAALFAAGGGYVFAKFRFPLRRVAFGAILGGVMIPANILAIPLYLMFSRVNGVNTFWAVFLPGLVSPLGIYLCRIFVEAGVPDEILEAARIDGAGEYRIFFSIVLRLMKPALITVFLFQLVAIWNNVLLPLVMLSDQRIFPVTLGLYGMYASSSSIGAPPDIVALTITGVFVSVVPLVIAFVALQRYWRGGVALGSVRG